MLSPLRVSFNFLYSFLLSTMHLSARFLVFLVFSFVVGTGTAEGGGVDDAPTDIPPIENGASSIRTADINGDGYIDVVSASDGDGEIAWYPNDGEGNFPEKEIIAIGAAGAQDLHVADLNGDGNPDLLGAFGTENTVAWYENNGNGTFSDQKAITSRAAGAVSVYAADLDEDGNKDVLSASRLDGKVAYYMNEGGGSFSEQKIISREGEGAQSVYATDLDGDGDPDVMYASSVRAGGSKIAWHRNTAAGFSNQNVISSRRAGATAVYASDLDSDGDVDILAGFSELGSGKIAWAENQDGSYSDMQVISSEMEDVNHISTLDLDDDGDEDILTTSGAAGGSGTISFFRSTAGTFASKSVVAENLSYAQSIDAADLNGNGVPDIVGASPASDTIALYINDLLQGFGFRDPVPIGRPTDR